MISPVSSYPDIDLFPVRDSRGNSSMGWISNDELHEGYLASVLVDGKTASASNGTGPVVMLADDQSNYTGKDEQRTHDEVVAWALRCDCASSNSDVLDTWTGDRWERVATPTLEDLENGQIYVAPDDCAAGIMDRPSVEAVARSR